MTTQAPIACLLLEKPPAVRKLNLAAQVLRVPAMPWELGGMGSQEVLDISNTDVQYFPEKCLFTIFPISVNGNSILVAQKFLLYSTFDPSADFNGSKLTIYSESGHFSPINHSHPVKATIMIYLNYGNSLLTDFPDLIFVPFNLFLS